MYIFFLRFFFFAAVVVFTDTFKTLSKDFCSMKTYYLQVRIQNHWTVPLDTPLEPQPHFYTPLQRTLFLYTVQKAF